MKIIGAFGAIVFTFCNRKGTVTNAFLQSKKTAQEKRLKKSQKYSKFLQSKNQVA